MSLLDKYRYSVRGQPQIFRLHLITLEVYMFQTEILSGKSFQYIPYI